MTLYTDSSSGVFEPLEELVGSWAAGCPSFEVDLGFEWLAWFKLHQKSDATSFDPVRLLIMVNESVAAGAGSLYTHPSTGEANRGLLMLP